MTTNENTTDAIRLIALANAEDVDIRNAMYDVMDAGASGTPLYDAIRGAFVSDDGFDDLMHQIDHELGDCTDDNPDCAWADDDDA